MGYGTTGGSGPGKIGSTNVDDKLMQISNQYRKRGSELYNTSKPLFNEMVSQSLEAFKTGGVNAQIPVIQRAVENSKQATGASFTEASKNLAAMGLGDSPFAGRILTQAKMQGDQATSQIPTSIARELMNMGGDLTGQGFGASSNMGQIATGGYSNLGSLDLQRKIRNADQFRNYMDKLQETTMSLASMAAGCLPTGTRILNHDLQWIPVESYQAGDAIVSRDHAGQMVPCTVKRTAQRPIPDTHIFTEFTVEGEAVRASPIHPVHGVLMDDAALGENKRHITARALKVAATHDLLLEGPGTGEYCVFPGVWMQSTIDPRHTVEK